MDSRQNENGKKNVWLTTNQSADAADDVNDCNHWVHGLFRDGFTHCIIKNSDELNLRLFN